MDDVLGYCHYSANPVGRLVLYACGEVPGKIDENFRLSDATCSALQLANFWQDVRVDFAKDRVYIPQNDMRRFGVSDETIARGIATPEFRALMRHEVDYARSLFEQGLPLIGRVNRDLALDLDLFSRGGLEILRAIERRDYDVLSARPAISKPNKARAGAARAGRQGDAVFAPRLAIFRKGRLTQTAPSHSPYSGRRLRGLPVDCQTRGQKLLLRLSRASRRAPQRHLRHLRLHAPGRRSGRRRKPAARGAPPAARCLAGGMARSCERCGDQPIPSFSPCAMRPALQNSA